MPRGKRALAEADSNAELRPKKRNTKNGQAKENAPPVTVDSEEQTVTRGKPAKKDTAGAKKPTTSKAQNHKIWVCLCSSENHKEDTDDEDEDATEEKSSDSDPKSKGCDGGRTCLCTKPMDEHPEHRGYVITKKGYELGMDWIIQLSKRDQDNFDMHFYNDFNGYGACEVIENTLLAFNKEISKKRTDPLMLWSQIEGMAIYLRFMSVNCYEFHNLDDPEANAKRIMLIGTAVLTTIDVLIERGLFKENGSVIRNIGYILSIFLVFLEDTDEIPNDDENGWKYVVVKKADEHDIIIKGSATTDSLVSGIREDIEDLGDSEADDKESVAEGMDAAAIEACYKGREPLWGIITTERFLEHQKSAVPRSWAHYSWPIEFAAYSEVHGRNGGKIGGKNYDLSAKGKRSLFF